MNQTITLRRSLLYVPGDRPEMLAPAGPRGVAKAAQRGADGLILNLEDAVAPARKELARQTVARNLATADFGGAEVIIRVNPLATDTGYLDLLSIMPHAPAAILLPKVTTVDEVRFAAWTVERLEGIHEVPAGHTKIMCMIESPAGILAAPEIAACHPRVAALIFGAADFSAETGCMITPDGRALLYATSRLVLAARSAGIDVIDAPHMKLNDAEGLALSAQMARELGFDGKSAIHPAQIAPVNAAFSPTQAQVAWARRVIEMLTGQPGGGLGAAVLDGQLIEAPHLTRARRILAVADVAKLGTET